MFRTYTLNWPKQACLALVCATAALCVASLPLAEANASEQQDTRPNILLIMFDDLSPHQAAYGESSAQTPTLDAFADEAIVYDNAYTTAAVCAPSRASMMMGMHQQSFGAQHMRASGFRTEDGQSRPYSALPPAHAKAFPELLRAAGYYTSNNGKTDYQLGKDFRTGPFSIWDDANAEHPWRQRPEGKPFFAMVNVLQTHERFLFADDFDPSVFPFGRFLKRELDGWRAERPPVHDPDDVAVPGYLPDTPVVRQQIALLLDNLHYSEKQVAQVLSELEEDGLADNTIVIITSDHGDPFPRAKRSLYNSGLQVPMMVRWPDKTGAATREDRLVSFVDFAPSLLSLAGAPVPEHMVGFDFLSSSDGDSRSFVFAAMDRHDDLPDYARAVSDGRWKYIRNYQPSHPLLRPMVFRDLTPMMQEFWRLHQNGELSTELDQYFADVRPSEELYDTEADPDELRNLANDPAHYGELLRMRSALQEFSRRTDDWSSVPEREMVRLFYPQSAQPITAAPRFEAVDGKLVLSSTTTGASIEYRVNEGAWRLYTAPLSIAQLSGENLEARAIRYGFGESEVAKFNATAR